MTGGELELSTAGIMRVVSGRLGGSSVSLCRIDTIPHGRERLHVIAGSDGKHVYDAVSIDRAAALARCKSVL
jgi:hypothetical protein